MGERGIPGTHRELLLAVRTGHHQQWAAAEDRFEIATLRAGSVRAAMLSLGVVEPAEWTGWIQAGALMEAMAKLPALGAMGGLGGGEYLLHFAVAEEEVN